jgi:hypothetical protein
MHNAPKFTAIESFSFIKQSNYDNRSFRSLLRNSITPAQNSYDDCLCRCYTCWQLPEGGCDPTTCLTFPRNKECMKMCLNWN